MRVATTICAATLGLTFAQAVSETHLCKRGPTILRLEVIYQGKDEKLPCEVVYQKGEMPKKKIYSAEYEKGYCEKKANDFADKLTKDKWQCALGDVSLEGEVQEKK